MINLKTKLQQVNYNYKLNNEMIANKIMMINLKTKLLQVDYNDKLNDKIIKGKLEI